MDAGDACADHLVSRFLLIFVFFFLFLILDSLVVCSAMFDDSLAPYGCTWGRAS